jgi:hypothetical protein
MARRFPLLTELELFVDQSTEISVFFLVQGSAQCGTKAFFHLSRLHLMFDESTNDHLWAMLESLPEDALLESPLTFLSLWCTGTLTLSVSAIIVLSRMRSLAVLRLWAHDVLWEGITDEFCSNRNLGVISIYGPLGCDVDFLRRLVVRFPLTPFFRLHKTAQRFGQMDEMLLSTFGPLRCELRKKLHDATLAKTGQFFFWWPDGTVKVFGCEDAE